MDVELVKLVGNEHEKCMRGRLDENSRWLRSMECPQSPQSDEAFCSPGLRGIEVFHQLRHFVEPETKRSNALRDIEESRVEWKIRRTSSGASKSRTRRATERIVVRCAGTRTKATGVRRLTEC